uniref:Serine/threonine-protein kinase Chk2 n=1 Tax=Sphaeramia orbicularis TaxID=375764 RepID=A0A673AHK3_9TELE
MNEEVSNEGDQSQAQSTLSPSQAQSTPSTQSLSQSKSLSQPGSSSSSGPTSGSQSSSGSGTLSSVDTIPVPLPSVPEEPEPEVRPWGRLLPMAQGFRAHDCIEDQYVFGRDKNQSDYVLGDPEERKSKKFLIYSKKHFRIYREDSEVFVEDYSNNGTFVDGKLIGQNPKLSPYSNKCEGVGVWSTVCDSAPMCPHMDFLCFRGVCGEVRLAFERSTCKKVAVKIINKKNFQSEGTATRNATTEIEILQRIDHPCLIKTLDFYQSEESYYIVLELMEGGELFNKVKSQQQLQEPVAKLYFYQMLLAVQYLHGNGIIHRDLKPENVLLSSSEDVCLVKLTDFNQSRILEEAVLMRTLCGTPSYLAPEVFTHASTTGYGLAVDAWSLGVLLFVCLGGYPPFHETFCRQQKGREAESVRDQIIRGEFTMVQSKWRHVSDQAKDVVRRLLVVDPTHRMSIQEALQHPWLQEEAEPEASAASTRKRGRRADEDATERPTAKRCQAPPPPSL